MRTAVLLLWASCLYMLARSVLLLLFAASAWKRLLVLSVLTLAASCAHRPQGRLSGQTSSLPAEDSEK